MKYLMKYALSILIATGGMIPIAAWSVVAGCGTATVDGMLEPGEWGNAGVVQFSANVPGGGNVAADLFVMNDSENLYLALRVPRSSLDSQSHVNYLFDNDNDGVGEDGDDFLAVSASGISFTDAFWSDSFDPPSLTFNDTDRGGTVDGAGTVVNDGSNTVFELSHPLNSSDDSNDFSLAGGDMAGLTLTLTLSPPSATTRFPVLPQKFTEIEIASCAIPVIIDIKPGSDSNCFNINGHGVIPVSILGAEDLDVTEIDMTSLSFGGLDVRMRGNKGPLCSVDYSNDDPYLDLICHFEDDSGMWAPGNGEATLTGNLFGGTSIEGSDLICIVP